VETMLTVADRYGARYLILDHNRPEALAPLYQRSAVHPRLSPIYEFDDESGRPVIVVRILPRIPVIEAE